MAKILIGIALVVMLATAGLGFMAKGNIDKLQTTLSSKKEELSSTKTKLTSTQGELKTSQESLTTANGKIEEQAKDIAEKKGTIDDLGKKVADANAQVTAKEADLAAANIKIDELMKKPGKGPSIVEGGSAELDAAKAELAKAKTEVAEAKQVAETMTNRVKDTETKMAALELDKKRRDIGLQRQGLTGRILAVNAGWNFVVLSVGDRQGILVNSPMLVMRGNEPIARVRITSVEPSTSIADVIPGSLRRGITVQPGDTVITEGRSSAAPQAAPGGPATAGAGR